MKVTTVVVAAAIVVSAGSGIAAPKPQPAPALPGVEIKGFFTGNDTASAILIVNGRRAVVRAGSALTVGGRRLTVVQIDDRGQRVTFEDDRGLRLTLGLKTAAPDPAPRATPAPYGRIRLEHFQPQIQEVASGPQAGKRSIAFSFDATFAERPPEATVLNARGRCKIAGEMLESTAPAIQILDEIQRGETRRVEGLVFNALTGQGFTAMPEACDFAIYHGPAFGDLGKPVAEFCWAGEQVRAGRCF